MFEKRNLKKKIGLDSGFEFHEIDTQNSRLLTFLELFFNMKLFLVIGKLYNGFVRDGEKARELLVGYGLICCMEAKEGLDIKDIKYVWDLFVYVCLESFLEVSCMSKDGE